MIRRVATLVVLLLLAARGASAQQGGIAMPDPKQMSGIPRPVTDLPPGTVSVRLIRGDLSNNITNFPVELHIGTKVQTVKTDDQGRAQFDKLPAGETLKAIAVVDGERLESQDFPSPTQSGIRLMLVATDKEKEARLAAEASAPAVTAPVVLGGETRMVIEPGDESIDVYYVLEVMNNSRTPVNPPTLFSFDLPTGARGASVFAGQEIVKLTATRVHAEKPFPPGKTTIQLGFSLPATTSSLSFEQRFPALVEQTAVLVSKQGDMKLASPQLDRQQDMNADGRTMIVGAGNPLPAGQPWQIQLSGLLHHSAVPRWTALGLALAIALVGVWAARKPAAPESDKDERKRLITRREKLLQDLVRLEQDSARGARGDQARYTARREDLLAALERVYAGIDERTDGPVAPRPSSTS